MEQVEYLKLKEWLRCNNYKHPEYEKFRARVRRHERDPETNKRYNKTRKLWRLNNEYKSDKEYSSRPEVITRCNQLIKERYAMNKEIILAKRKEPLTALKIKARAYVNHAVRDKRMVKENCSICGNTKSHAHHDDYTYFDKVTWLCAKHHNAWHRVFQAEVPNG